MISLPKGAYVPKFELRRTRPRRWKAEVVRRYRILAELESEGAATVYKAEDIRLHRSVALKMLPVSPDGRKSPEVLAAVLNTLNICTVYESGDAEGHSYIASAFIAGENLGLKIKRAVSSCGRRWRSESRLPKGLWRHTAATWSIATSSPPIS